MVLAEAYEVGTVEAHFPDLRRFVLVVCSVCVVCLVCEALAHSGLLVYAPRAYGGPYIAVG